MIDHQLALPRTRMAIVTNKAATYRRELFDVLSKSEYVDVRVFIFEDDGVYIQNSFKNIYEIVPGLAIRRGNNTITHIPACLFSALRNFAPEFIICGGASFPTLIALLYRWLYKSRVYIWWAGTKLSEKKRFLPIRVFRKWVFGIPDGFYAYSTYCKEYLEAMGVPPAKIVVIGNNTLNTEEYGRVAREARHKKDTTLLNKFVIFVVSQLVERKNIITVLKSYSALSKKYPFIELKIAGEGPQKRKLKRYCEANSLLNVTFLGNVSSDEVIKEYAASDSLVHPALIDQWPQVVNEAMSCGVPVIISSTSGVDDYFVVHEKNGYVVEPSDEKALEMYMERLIQDPLLRIAMGQEAYRIARKFDLKRALQFIEKEVTSLKGSGKHVAVIWQRFLPYHSARIRQLRTILSTKGFRLTAIEVASQDNSYGFPKEDVGNMTDRLCCFPGTSYHDHKAGDVHAKILDTLKKLGPDVVFAPATAFPEGMAAILYRQLSGTRMVLMDDAWQETDQRGILTRAAKRIIHKSVDAAFIPAFSHLSYYESLNIPEDRIVYGVDVVDNNYFSQRADAFRAAEKRNREENRLPENYFLFVGRFLPSKGIEALLEAYKLYREKTGQASWDLVLVGDGQYFEKTIEFSKKMHGIHLPGRKFGDDLCAYYALARFFIVPSERDPWGLVVNEAMASGLPVLVSSACGSAKTLVQKNRNGWTFEAQDIHALSALMSRASALPDQELKAMGAASRAIISEWSLDRFSHGVLAALEITRRQPAGYLSDIIVKLWKGRVKVN